MKLAVRELNGLRIVLCDGAITRLDEALEFVAACVESDSTRVLLEADQLPPAFFDLRSGFAGEFLQKLQNYQLRVAAVFPTDGEYSSRFREFLAEATRGRMFRVFAVRSDAEDWLVSQ